MNVLVTNLHSASLALPYPFHGTVAASGTKTLQVSLNDFTDAEKLKPLQNDIKSGKLRVEVSDADTDSDTGGLLDEAVRALIAGYAETQIITQIVDAAASTATTNRVLGVAGAKKLYVKDIKIVNGSAVTADGTDYATATFAKKSSAFGSAVTLGTRTTNSSGGSTLAAGTSAVNISGASDTERTLLENEVLVVDVAKGGSGKQLNIAICVTYMLLPGGIRAGNL